MREPVLHCSKTKMYRLIIGVLFLFIFNEAQKIRYISTEHPCVLYYNPKYMTYANLTSTRHDRYDPLYYVELNFYMLYRFDNNISVDFIFYEFLTNRYRRSFVEMHFKVCDLIEKDPFFGTALRQGKLLQPCPYPPGAYNLYNMSIPLKHIPHNFPFTKGRIFMNMTGTYTKDLVANGYIDMEIKETRLRKKPKEN